MHAIFTTGVRQHRQCEKFALDELTQIARWARDVGCHAIALHFNSEAGYVPPVPIAPAKSPHGSLSTIRTIYKEKQACRSKKQP